MARDAVPPGTLVLGRGAATRVEVSASCLLVVALLAVLFAPRAVDLVPGLEAAALLVGAAVGVLVYAAALLHESAHALVARRHGHAVPAIRLTAAGGRTAVDGTSATPAEEAVTAAAGPAVSLALGLLALAGRLAVDGGVAALVLEALVVANLVIGLLDLLPAAPLDGGRLVRAAAWAVTGSVPRSYLAAGWVGRGVAGVLVLVPFAVAATTGRTPTLTLWAACLLLALLAWAGSSAQLAAAAARAPEEH
ncbi:site-2 protease family protein [Nocardioides litoris]|uniref:site-2 protease family protein n=1 Tax=Nocardioides litoris TaxID=1926648 RepID=UPI00111D97E3|nr:site-2 protease family protein [Nocardioides litoris]